MSKARMLVGYMVVVVVFVIALLGISMTALSPWLNSAAAVLAILAAIRFTESMSIVVVGVLVATLTIVLPIAMLLAIRANSGLSPLAYLGPVDLAQYALPTLSALALLTTLKRSKRSNQKCI